MNSPWIRVALRAKAQQHYMKHFKNLLHTYIQAHRKFSNMHLTWFLHDKSNNSIYILELASLLQSTEKS